MSSRGECAFIEGPSRGWSKGGCDATRCGLRFGTLRFGAMRCDAMRWLVDDDGS